MRNIFLKCYVWKIARLGQLILNSASKKAVVSFQPEYLKLKIISTFSDWLLKWESSQCLCQDFHGRIFAPRSWTSLILTHVFQALTAPQPTLAPSCGSSLTSTPTGHSTTTSTSRLPVWRHGRLTRWSTLHSADLSTFTRKFLGPRWVSFGNKS